MDSPGLLGDGHARLNRHRSDSLLHFLAAQVSLLVLMPSETEVGLVLPLLWGRFALIPKGYFLTSRGMFLLFSLMLETIMKSYLLSNFKG